LRGAHPFHGFGKSHRFPRGWFQAGTLAALRYRRERELPYMGDRLRLVRDGDAVRAFFEGRAVPCRLVHGVVMVWHDPQERAEDWSALPVVDHRGFSEFRFAHLRLACSAETVQEGHIDFEHVREATRPQRISGARLDTSYRFECRTLPFAGKQPLAAELRLLGSGLGYTLTVTEASNGIVTQHLVLPRPVTENGVDLLFGTSLRVDRLDRIHGALGKLPVALARSLLCRIVALGAQRELLGRARLWEAKTAAAPRSASADSPWLEPQVATYRAWAAQFYARVPERHARAQGSSSSSSSFQAL
jgi:hypothetical protein